MTKLNPVNINNRIHSIDMLRGFALLGILIMNIISFSNIGIGYVNPTLGAGLEGYNKWIHAFSHLFADMRFMSIFSILFGAGVLLFSDNALKKGRKARKFHYRRMFLLFLFGLIHAYLIWMGDILVMYSICGSMVFLMRNWKIKTLVIVASIFFAVPILFSFATYFFTPPDQLQEIFQFWTPSQAEIDEEIVAYRGSYLDQMGPRIASAFQLQTLLFLMEQMWRILSMMMVGMILYRGGVLSAEKDNAFYKRLFTIGMTTGLFISSVGLYRAYAHNWEGIWYMNIGHFYNYIGSFLVALGYIGLVMWWSKSTFLIGFQNKLKAVGRLAFTNYILTSVICTFIFYGHGLGLYATFDRLQQWGVVVLVWLVLLIISPIILKKYKQGPLESIWRKLTYL